MEKVRLCRLALSTPESALPNNAETLTARSPNCNKRSRDTPCSVTSAQVSTSRDPTCVPFWNESTRDWSRKLWSCTATDLRASAVTYWSGFSRGKDANSWFTVQAKQPLTTPRTSLTTCSPSQQSLWRLITENEAQKENDAAESTQATKKRKQARSRAKKTYDLPRARKVRVYPKAAERTTLRQWFGVTRKVYNIATEVLNAVQKKDVVVLAEIEASKERGEEKARGDKEALRFIIRQRVRAFREANEWVKECPQSVYDSGVMDAFDAFNANKAKQAERASRGEKKETTAVFKFRSKKDANQTMLFNRRDWHKGKVKELRSLFKTKKEVIPGEVECAVRVQMDRLGRVFLCFVREVEVKSENQAPNLDTAFHSTATLDPGVRTFQTIYDADGNAVEWGAGDMQEVFKLCKAADVIQSRINKKGGNTTSRRRAYYRQLQRIKNKIKECHNKLALWLCENFRAVLIPVFETSRMIQRRNRKIDSKTVRQMCCWSHFAFRQALTTKAQLFPWCKVVEVDEAYTSKTCDECGFIHQALGSNNTFKCPGCAHEADRDIHAARNILLRYLTREGIKATREGGDVA